MFLAAMLLPCVAPADNSDLGSLRKILLREDPNINYGLSVPDEDLRLQAIKQLETDGSAKAVGILKDFLTAHHMNPQLKQHALTALGRIGTQDAVDAVTEFELWSKSRFAKPPPWKFGRMDFATDHFGPRQLNPVAKTADEKGKTWAIFAWDPYCTKDIWLTCSQEKGSWSKPILLHSPDMPALIAMTRDAPDKAFRLQVKGDSVTVTCDAKTAKSSIAESLKDSDKDELPDIVEARLHTDPNNPDSDQDGVPDGSDSNPLTPKHKKSDDITEIRQAVFSAFFATSDCRDAILIVDNGDFAKQEYYGYGGFVLRGPKIREGLVFVNVTEFIVKIDSPTTATAHICDWEGNMAASVHEARLKKINGKWVVVKFMLVEIS
jgi:hypothetical protein